MNALCCVFNALSFSAVSDCVRSTIFRSSVVNSSRCIRAPTSWSQAKKTLSRRIGKTFQPHRHRQLGCRHRDALRLRTNPTLLRHAKTVLRRTATRVGEDSTGTRRQFQSPFGQKEKEKVSVLN